jgi:regulator of protease activity HflC (stomatin/prohibitin superfamily)
MSLATLIGKTESMFSYDVYWLFVAFGLGVAVVVIVVAIFRQAVEVPEGHHAVVRRGKRIYKYKPGLYVKAPGSVLVKVRWTLPGLHGTTVVSGYQIPDVLNLELKVEVVSSDGVKCNILWNMCLNVKDVRTAVTSGDPTKRFMTEVADKMRSKANTMAALNLKNATVSITNHMTEQLTNCDYFGLSVVSFRVVEVQLPDIMEKILTEFAISKALLDVRLERHQLESELVNAKNAVDLAKREHNARPKLIDAELAFKTGQSPSAVITDSVEQAGACGTG